MKHSFYKKVNMKNTKSMFNFINKHCKYWTTYPWTIVKTIANKIKEFELDTEKDISSIDIESLQTDINSKIKQFQENQPGYSVFVDEGYLLLCGNTLDKTLFANRRTVLPSCYLNFDNYDEWKNNIESNGKKIEDYFYELKYLTMLISDFDLLCDDIRDLCQKYL